MGLTGEVVNFLQETVERQGRKDTLGEEESVPLILSVWQEQVLFFLSPVSVSVSVSVSLSIILFQE